MIRIKKRAKQNFRLWKRVYRDFFDNGYSMDTIAAHYGFSRVHAEDVVRYGIKKVLRIK